MFIVVKTNLGGELRGVEWVDGHHNPTSPSYGSFRYVGSECDPFQVENVSTLTIDDDRVSRLYQYISHDITAVPITTGGAGEG